MDYRNCSVGSYHAFKVVDSPYISKSKEQVEKCSLCGVKKIYHFNKDGSMVNSRQYFLDHIRYFAQPIPSDDGMMAAFLFCSPRGAALLKADKEIDQRSEQFSKDMSERFRFALGKALKNEDWTDKTKDGIDRSSSRR